MGGAPARSESELTLDRSHDVAISEQDGQIEILTTGHDPYVIWKVSAQPFSSGYHVLQFEYFAVEPIDDITAFLGPPITEAGKFELPELTQAEGWQSYAADLMLAAGKPLPADTKLLRIDFGMRAGVRFRLRGVGLRRQTEAEVQRTLHAESVRQARIADGDSIKAYLSTDFDATFDRIEVLPETIRIAAESTSSVRLHEILPSASISQTGLLCEKQPDLSDRRFTLEVERFVDGRDRLYSGWRLARAAQSDGLPEYVSARHYPTSIVSLAAQTTRDRLRPKSQKGLGGIDFNGPLDELPELGVHAMTVNLVLNGFVSEQGGEGRERIDDGRDNRPMYFNPAPFAHYDRIIDFARRHNIVVSAIVLIPRGKNPQTRSPFVHPDSDGGIYAMPDLTSPSGVHLYTNVLERIARRYRDPTRAPGAITHWIAHNEIDFHTIWTNMGRQPREVVTETYYRSMRMISQAARQHDANATVFVSLTHHWNVPEDGDWRRLAPRDVLESLQRYSELEGDFAWGVAYHPYPQSLFATVSWSDRDVTDDFDTPLITMQNLQVLGRFLQQPHMRDTSGRVRTVLLSEQGFHTADYTPRSQNFQAESLSYAMQRVKQMPWIESFHYHRWMDHPDEGGLKLGLRSLPTPAQPHGVRKQAWFVYQAIR